MKDPLVEKLEAEIRYLKKLLDDNGIPYDDQASVDGARAQCGEVKFPELTPEHAIQFYSYFRGRKDVYVKRSSKKGYYTQCNNFWKYGVCLKTRGERVKCQECPSKDYTELKVSAILEHLKGEKEDSSDVIGLILSSRMGLAGFWFLISTIMMMKKLRP